MDQEIAKVVSFAICGLSNLLTTQIQVFMQMSQQRNSQLELLGKLIFNRNITLAYLNNKSPKGIPRIVDFGKDRAHRCMVVQIKHGRIVTRRVVKKPQN